MWPAVLASLGIATVVSLTAGCIMVRDRDRHVPTEPGPDDPPPTAVDPLLVTIDTDSRMAATPGDGVGVFVEYGIGGAWRVWMTCDTSYSGEPCYFDVYASVEQGAPLGDVAGEDLEGQDRVMVLEDGELHLQADTTFDTDGMVFSTDPGEIVRIEVWLDGYPEARFTYWVGDGVQHHGAPTNPLDFMPSTP